MPHPFRFLPTPARARAAAAPDRANGLIIDLLLLGAGTLIVLGLVLILLT